MTAKASERRPHARMEASTGLPTQSQAWGIFSRSSSRMSSGGSGSSRPASLAEVRGLHRLSARAAQNGHPVPRSRTDVLERHQHVDELVDGTDLDGLPPGGRRPATPHLARQRRGVGGGSGVSRGGTAALENHHRLPRCRAPQGREETPAVTIPSTYVAMTLVSGSSAK